MQISRQDSAWRLQTVFYQGTTDRTFEYFSLFKMMLSSKFDQFHAPKTKGKLYVIFLPLYLIFDGLDTPSTLYTTDLPTYVLAGAILATVFGTFNMYS